MGKLLASYAVNVDWDSEPPCFVEPDIIDDPEPGSKVVKDAEPEP